MIEKHHYYVTKVPTADNLYHRNVGVHRGGSKMGICTPLKLGLRTKKF